MRRSYSRPRNYNSTLRLYSAKPLRVFLVSFPLSGNATINSQWSALLVKIPLRSSEILRRTSNRYSRERLSVCPFPDIHRSRHADDIPQGLNAGLHQHAEWFPKDDLNGNGDAGRRHPAPGW